MFGSIRMSVSLLYQGHLGGVQTKVEAEDLKQNYFSPCYAVDNNLTHVTFIGRQ